MAPSRTSPIYNSIRLDFKKGRKFRVVQEENMRRIVDMMVTLFMLALVVAPYPSLSRMATPQDCVVECDAYCQERWKGDTRNLRLCYVNCKKLCGVDLCHRCHLWLYS